MNNERTTKTLKTSGGHELVMLDYITGKEARDIKEVQDVGKASGSTDGNAANNTHDYAMGIIIKSLDGNADKIVDRIVNLPLTDFSEITDEIVSLLTPKKK